MERSDSFEFTFPDLAIRTGADHPPSTPLAIGSARPRLASPNPPPNASQMGSQGSMSASAPLPHVGPIAPESPSSDSFHFGPMVGSLPDVRGLNANAPPFRMMRPIRGQGYKASGTNKPYGPPPPHWLYRNPSVHEERTSGSGRLGSKGKRLQRSFHLNANPGRECKFCKNNGESPESYKSHVLRNPATGQLICNVLREHVCEVCGATGDDAHTRNYCPKVKQEKKLKYAIPNLLKSTRHQSDGKVRSKDKNNNGNQH